MLLHSVQARPDPLIFAAVLVRFYMGGHTFCEAWLGCCVEVWGIQKSTLEMLDKMVLTDPS